jgi:Flp pilus assembly protein TadB
VGSVTFLAGISGGLTIVGLATLMLELTRSAPRLGAPHHQSVVVSKATRRRMLIAFAAGLITLAITRWPVATIAAALAVFFLPRLASSRPARRRVELLEGLEQWTRRLSDMLMVGRGIEDALEASARQAGPAIAPAVAALARRLSARTGTEAALRAFAADIADPAGDRIAAALIIATGRRGGAVTDVLRSLAAMLARDVAARREIEADQAQHRTTVKWLTLFALGFGAFAVVNKAYSAPFGSVAGQFVMAIVVALYAAGLGWLHHLGSVPAPGRFLETDTAVPVTALPVTGVQVAVGQGVIARSRSRPRGRRDHGAGDGAHVARRPAGRRRRRK